MSVEDNLMDFFIKLFNETKDTDSYFKFMCNCTVPQMIIKVKYSRLTPIEGISHDERIELFEYAKELFPEKNEHDLK